MFEFFTHKRCCTSFIIYITMKCLMHAGFAKNANGQPKMSPLQLLFQSRVIQVETYVRRLLAFSLCKRVLGNLLCLTKKKHGNSLEHGRYSLKSRRLNKKDSCFRGFLLSDTILSSLRGGIFIQRVAGDQNQM